MEIHDAGLIFDLQSKRWPLTAALVWIATRDELLTGRLGQGDVESARWEINIRNATQGQHISSPNQGWSELSDALSDGKISAIATRVQVDKISGSNISSPGALFPPADQPGAALHCEIVDRDSGPVIAFSDGLFAQRLVEWLDVSLPRSIILHLWPPSEAIQIDEMDVYRTGAPGRPSAMQFVLKESAKRIKRGITEIKLVDEAKALHEWCLSEHPGQVTPSAKTIENRIRADHMEHRKNPHN